MFWEYDDEDGEVKPKKEEKEYPNSDESGAELRFQKRIKEFKSEAKPIYKHHSWWFVHNCIAHPLIGVIPCKSTFDFHDWTSKKINGF